MSTEPQLAFYQRLPEPPGLEIRVNFGIFAGRPATAAEIDELAQSLPEYIPEDEHEADVLAGRIVEAAESWARDCVADRRAEISEP